MKLGGWRTKSYPIEILVDNQVVFKGDTERSLGYVTIPLKPTAGKSVTIQLIGATQNKEEEAITEITGKTQEAGTANPKEGKGTLTLVEVELYGPVSAASR